MRNTIFPAYVVIDFSESMAWTVDSRGGRPRIEVAKEIIPTLLKSMKTDLSVAESLRVRVIGFNQGLAFCTEMFDYRGLEKWYNEEKAFFKSKCQWQTWYGAAFKKIHECIDNDINKLIREGKSYYRPLVYFLTDGVPEGEDSKERDRKYRALVNNSDSHRNPVIFCVGIGTGDMSILEQYGASRLGSKNGEYRTHNKKMTFVIRKGVKTGDGLEVLNENVVETIKYSLQQRDGSVSNHNKREIDTDVFEDEEVGSLIEQYFNVDQHRWKK